MHVQLVSCQQGLGNSISTAYSQPTCLMQEVLISLAALPSDYYLQYSQSCMCSLSHASRA